MSATGLRIQISKDDGKAEVSRRHAELLEIVRARLIHALRGKDEIVELSLATFLAGGHLLLEGAPGTGKTTLAKAMAGAFGGTFRRIQMTSDLLPSDIVGILRLLPGDTELEFRKGPLFSNFVLADELNRTGPKTQSALLEAMAEKTVSVDGRSYSLPDAFFVVATQNPLEFHGVYPLAESQLDRFMMQLHFTPPEKDSELKVYTEFTAPIKKPDLSTELSGTFPALDAGEEAPPLLTIEETLSIRARIAQIHVDPSVVEYMTAIIRATRIHSMVSHGVSIRGGLQFFNAARGLALLRHREYVSPSDAQTLAIPLLAHRLCFRDGDPDREARHSVIREILDRLPVPK